MRISTHNDHTSWQHIWRLAWPIIISNVTVPLVGAVDVAMMGRINDPAFIGGVGLALSIAAILWLGDTVILGLFTTQAALIAHAHNHWLWACLLAPASFLAFQLDGIFVGATRGQDMRNAMVFSAIGLGLALLLLNPLGLHGLLAAFVGYLGLRGASLWWHIDRAHAQAV